VLYIATVHYKSPRWIEIQARHLREHISVPFQTWTSLEGIDPAYSAHFDRVIEQKGSHAEKLNHLALEISHEAADEDMLMFLDGDAFPIADPMPLILAGLAEAPLVAVRRAENVNEPQPHPCFCITTVGTWRRLPGDWSRGPVWAEVRGQPVSDVGANLLRTLELTKTPWIEVLRSHGAEQDSLLFAVYGDTIYHHGGGFRAGSVLTRRDREDAPRRLPASPIPGVSRAVRFINRWRKRSWRNAIQQRNQRQSEIVYEKIARGGSDWLEELNRDE
jgi:hypothetical protein